MATRKKTPAPPSPVEYEGRGEARDAATLALVGTICITVLIAAGFAFGASAGVHGLWLIAPAAAGGVAYATARVRRR